MQKRDWTDLAHAFGELRREIDEKWPPKTGYISIDPDVPHRRLIRAAELGMLDRAARLLAAELGKRKTRFDARRFLELVGVELDDDAR